MSDRSTDQAREDELCECDHTAHWHSHDGKGDCEGTKFGAPGSWIPCECKAFSAVSDTAGWKEAVDTYYDDPYSRISAMFNAGQDMAERLRVVLKERDEAVAELLSYDRAGMLAVQNELQMKLASAEKARETLLGQWPIDHEATKADLLRAEEALRRYENEAPDWLKPIARDYFAARAALSLKGQPNG